MAIIKAFKALRRKDKLANKVCALLYDVVNSEEAKILAKHNSYSFLHIDKSEIYLDEYAYEYDPKVYLKAKENLDEFRGNNSLI